MCVCLWVCGLVSLGFVYYVVGLFKCCLPISWCFGCLCIGFCELGWCLMLYVEFFGLPDSFVFCWCYYGLLYLVYLLDCGC